MAADAPRNTATFDEGRPELVVSFRLAHAREARKFPEVWRLVFGGFFIAKTKPWRPGSHPPTAQKSALSDQNLGKFGVTEFARSSLFCNAWSMASWQLSNHHVTECFA